MIFEDINGTAAERFAILAMRCTEQRHCLPHCGIMICPHKHTSSYGQTHSPTMEEKVSSQPDGMSKICLSCHDGIVAPDAYGGNTCGTAILFDKDLIGTFPSNNHPISFIYNTALATKNKDLYDPSTKLSGVTGSTETINTDMLFLNRMECASCHDVHNKYAVPKTKLLVKDNAGSALCLTCHNK